MINKIALPVDKQFPITFSFGEAPKWYVDVFGYPHNGLDFGCPIGTSIVACDDGFVSFCDDIADGDGKGIQITHEWGISIYWHLSRLGAVFNQAVTKASFIGLSGDTGFVTGPHLHFGIKVWGAPVVNMRGWSNPALYFGDTPTPPTPPAPFPRTYIVFPGDTLWSIAVKFYGNGLEWHRIYLANQDKISNPNIIRVFQKLIIP